MYEGKQSKRGLPFHISMLSSHTRLHPERAVCTPVVGQVERYRVAGRPIRLAGQ